MKRALKCWFLLALTITFTLNACNQVSDDAEKGTGSGQVEFQGNTYQLDASDMYIILNDGFPPLHQINIWKKGQRTIFIITIKSTSNSELIAGTYTCENINSTQFTYGSIFGFGTADGNVFEPILEISKEGKIYDIVFTAYTSSEGEQLDEHKVTVTWSGTLPVAAVRQF